MSPTENLPKNILPSECKSTSSTVVVVFSFGVDGLSLFEGLSGISADVFSLSRKLNVKLSSSSLMYS